MTADALLSYFEHVTVKLGENNGFEILFSIIDPEGLLRNLFDFYACLMDVFADNHGFP